MAGVEDSHFPVPQHFMRPPPIQDDLLTETSSAQRETVADCLPYLKGTADLSRSRFDFNEHGVPRLDRLEHVNFLHQSLEEFPAAFVAVDASRPWMVYWALMGLYLLGEDVSQYRNRLVKSGPSVWSLPGTA
jgi:protein farnesyltransferase subunit beta